MRPGRSSDEGRARWVEALVAMSEVDGLRRRGREERSLNENWLRDDNFLEAALPIHFEKSDIKAPWLASSWVWRSDLYLLGERERQ